MKKIIAVFLLFVSLLASGHVTWVFHYCSGSLCNAGLAGYVEIRECGCAKTQRGFPSEGRPAVENTPCCANIFVSQDTDDCSAVRQETMRETTHTDLRTAPFAASELLRPCGSPLSRQHAFPPEGRARDGAALRRLTCVYRI
ncbi:MAG: hypothetical protein LBP64_11035 [Tannerella sp.]|jgi:hypothetical protein|nr:hypothetical protein [Tannerella sp.]